MNFSITRLNKRFSILYNFYGGITLTKRLTKERKIEMMNDCYAAYDKEKGYVRVGNGRVEKIMQQRGSFIRTEKITDKVSGKVWRGGKPLWQRCPALSENEIPEVFFEVAEETQAFGMKEHLKATLTLKGREGTVWYEYTVFPDIPFVYSQCFVEKRGRVELNDETAQEVSCTGIETDYVKSAEGDVICSSDTLDCVPLGCIHLTVESVKLYDKTDGNDSLVERQTVPVYKNGRSERDGNIFCINDYPSGSSLMLVKHSPTESSALNRRTHDLLMHCASYAALLGTGIDFSALPSGRVPYYASAVGAAKAEDIYEELWRYSTAFSLGDRRGSLFIMSNTWGDRSQDGAVCESFMLRELERARQLHVDIIQIDDGWQSGITVNSALKKGGVWEGYYKENSNFWAVNTEKFPRGLKPITEKAREIGAEIGLWFSPDSSCDFANVDKDIETIYRLYRDQGVCYFKLDGIKIRNKLCEMRFIYLLSELTKRSDGEIRFNLDVTAEDRFGYLYQQQYGTLFVENRYTDFTSYFPHNTFKNLWNLASVIPTRRLQMELLNVRRNADKYKNMPFAPDTYNMDYVFATVIPANPLVWMEMTGLSENDAALLSKITGIYKPYAPEIFASRVIPIGDAPSGMSFSGYCCRSEDKKTAHLLLFRESTKGDTYTFNLPVEFKNVNTEKLYESAPAECTFNGESVTVKFSEERSFVWIKIN